MRTVRKGCNRWARDPGAHECGLPWGRIRCGFGSLESGLWKPEDFREVTVYGVRSEYSHRRGQWSVSKFAAFFEGLASKAPLVGATLGGRLARTKVGGAADRDTQPRFFLRTEATFFSSSSSLSSPFL
jgi:hypothetical protein